MKSKLLLFFACVLLTFLLTMQSSCYYDKSDKLYPTLANCDTTNVSYSAIIVPILTAECYSCHSTANASNGGNNDLSVYTSLLVFVQNGKLLCDINFGSGCNEMPLNSTSKLPACDIEQITAWVNAGAPDN